MTDPAPADGEADAAAATGDDAGVSERKPQGDPGDEESAYRGIVGAFPYAFRASDSILFKSYAAIGGLLAVVVTVLFVSAIVVLLGNTASSAGGVFTFSRALYAVLMLSVVAPLAGPVLSVARRHRRATSTVAYDRAVAVAGYLFVAALYVGLIISTPPQQREATDGLLGPVFEALYALPRESGAIPPILAVAGIYLVHRRYR